MSDVLKIESDLAIFFEEVSKTFSDFQKSTNLPCLSGCGHCCLNPGLEATIMEMIPMALNLEKEGKAIDMLNHYEAHHPTSCMVYESHSEDSNQGRCGQYETRPFLCRAFAVAGLKDKDNHTTYSVCKIIKDTYPETYKRLITNEEISNIPYIQNWSTKLSHIHPEMLNRRLPISEALYEALLKILTLKSFKNRP